MGQGLTVHTVGAGGIIGPFILSQISFLSPSLSLEDGTIQTKMLGKQVLSLKKWSWLRSKLKALTYTGVASY